MAKKDRSNEPKVLRLKQIYDETGFKSINAFCKFLRCSQPTTYNYYSGYRVPSNEYMLMLSKAFPQYNQDWVIYGTGEKFNPAYVEVRQRQTQVIAPVQITQTQEQPQDQVQKQPTESMAMMQERLASMGERMATMAEKLADWVNKCSSLESQLKSALEVIEEFKKEKSEWESKQQN